MSHKIYIVEDDSTICLMVTQHLEQWGYDMYSVSDFQAIPMEIESIQPDLVLLDISLPFYNGFHWCQEIRKTSLVPIVFMSSADDNVNIVMAMSMGGDDYIVKPFDLSVLVAKIQAILRRSYQYTVNRQELRYKNFVFDPSLNQLFKDDLIVPLTPNESRIFFVLLSNKGKIVQKETIISSLWEEEAYIDTNTLSVNITRLRRKLSTANLDDVIQTIKGQGYLLVEEND